MSHSSKKDSESTSNKEKSGKHEKESSMYKITAHIITKCLDVSDQKIKLYANMLDAGATLEDIMPILETLPLSLKRLYDQEGVFMRGIENKDDKYAKEQIILFNQGIEETGNKILKMGGEPKYVKPIDKEIIIHIDSDTEEEYEDEKRSFPEKEWKEWKKALKEFKEKLYLTPYITKLNTLKELLKYKKKLLEIHEGSAKPEDIAMLEETIKKTKEKIAAEELKETTKKDTYNNFNIYGEYSEEKKEEIKPKKKAKEVSSDSKEERRKPKKKLADLIKEKAKKIKEAEPKDREEGIKKSKKQPKLKEKQKQDRNTPDEEKKIKDNKEISDQYDPQDKYYVQDYLNACTAYEGAVYDSLKEAFEAAREKLEILMSRVCKLITGKSVFAMLKLNDAEPFTATKDIKPGGIYGPFRNGFFTVKFKNPNEGEPIRGKKGKVDEEEVSTKQFPPFCFLENNRKLLAGKVISKPYHSDEPNHINNHFNVFPGFKAKKLDMTYEQCKEKLKPLLDHIMKVWAKGDRTYYEYHIGWLCYGIMHLTDPETLLGIIGVEGNGKSLVFRFLVDWVYGKNIAVIVEGLSFLTEKFNSELANKMLICIDEPANTNSDSSKCLEVAEKLKFFLTNPDQRIRKLYEEAFTVESHASVAITTNNEKPVVMNNRSRRFALYKSLDKLETLTHYTNLANYILNQKMGDIFYTFARLHKCTLDLKIIQDTDARETCIKECEARGNGFFTDVFEDGSYPIPEEFIVKEDERGIMISNKNLYKVYKAWHEETKNGFIWNNNTFSKNIAKGMPKLEKININNKRGSGMHYILTKNMFDKINVVDSLKQEKSLGDFLKPPPPIHRT